MTVQFMCDCCGQIVDVPDEEDEAIVPPKGWRAIRTVIFDFGEDHTFNTWKSENLHSCDACNVHMSVEEHIEAELESRRRSMHQPQK